MAPPQGFNERWIENATPGVPMGRRVGRGLIYATLVILLLVVSLPLLWMVLTALKVKGTAFQFEFLPRRTLYTPAYPEAPFTLPVVKMGEKFFHAELSKPGATNVDLVLRDENGEKKTFPMQFMGGGGEWAATAGPLSFSKVAWSFLADGSEEIAGGPKSGAAEFMDLKEGMNAAPGADKNLFYLQDGAVVGAFTHKADGRKYSLLINERESILLSTENEASQKNIQSAFRATVFRGGAPETYRLVVRRSLGDAIRAKYTLGNFRFILTSKDFNFARYFFNSLIVATSAGFFTVLLCSMAAFAFGFFHFHFRDALFTLLLASMLVPGMIYMVPQFSITLKFGMMNTYAGMIVPHLANVFGLFLMRQYIMQIPHDLFCAAEIDGASDMQIFRNIVVPMCLPIMVTLFLVVFVGQWSNFLWQLIVNTGDSGVLTLPVGLQQFKGQNANDWERIIAGACFSILPISALFMALQNYFLQGLAAGAVKE